MHMHYLYYLVMTESKVKRSSISVTPEDVRTLRKLRGQLRTEHGKLTFAAIVRIALRKLVNP